jgi:predicted RNA-binding Zn ribbon-like protein
MSRAVNPQLCVEFVNTVDWRTDPMRIMEKLTTFDDLVHWAVEHRVISEGVGRKVLRRGHGHSRVAGQVLDRAIALRDAIYRVLSAVAAEIETPRDDLRRISDEAQAFASRIRLSENHGGFTWEWHGDDDALDRVLWPVLQSVTQLLTSDSRGRIRECEGPGCGWIILDQTKNRSRRWCEMKTCGNRAKVKRFYERHKEEMAKR